MSEGIDRRNFLRSAGALAIGTVISAPAIGKETTVRYTLSWLPTGQYAFVYVAKQLGFWKKRGINVEISRGYGSLGAIQGIDGGKFDMGGAATGAVINSVIKGSSLKIIGTQAYDATMGIIVLDDSPIRKPADFEGRSIGVTAAGGDTPFLLSYLKSTGVDASKVSIVSLDSQIIEQAVISRKVDAMVAFGVSSIPNFVTQNAKIRFFPWTSAGLQFYWVNTLARQDYLEKNRQLVADVSEGLNEGIRYMLLNPQETVDIHLKANPEIAISKNGRLFTELGVGMISSVIDAPESREHGIGYSDLAKIDRQARLVRQFLGAAGDPAPPLATTYVTNELIGSVKLNAAQWQQVRQSSAPYAKYLST